ncbi:short chain dehydrogenase [Nitrospina gracilis]|nr:short chain dehydrogenase [Nitrospina gracilis]
MKIILVGASGTIGQAVVKELGERHEIVPVGSKSGDVQVDMSSIESIKKMYEKVGSFDSLICTAGNAHFGSLTEMTEEEFYIGIKSKLMGQINLVLQGIPHVSDNGSFTLTSGALSQDPIPFGSSVSMVNAAVEGFVLGASIELPRGIRINAVSPNVVEESLPKFGQFFRGHVPVPAARVALAYSKSVEGKLNGKIIRAK